MEFQKLVYYVYERGWYVCACADSGACGVCLSAIVYVWRIEDQLSLSFLQYLSQDLFIVYHNICQVKLGASEDALKSIFYLIIWVLKLQIPTTLPSLHMGSWNLNLGPHSCTGRILLKKPFLQPLSVFNYCSNNTSRIPILLPSLHLCMRVLQSISTEFYTVSLELTSFS